MKTETFPFVPPRMLRALRGVVLACCVLPLGSGIARASVAYGTINNFDTVNDTGVECHGFEIEIEDIHSADITYTYNWNHYGTPKITEDNSNPLHSKVRIRYESARNADGTWAAYTAIPAGPILPTDGHQFTNPGINFGGEHFGAGYRGTPTNITYHWLVDNGAGVLVLGPAVNVATPTFTYYPPAGAAPAQVQAAIVPPPPPVPDPLEFGKASWVKEIRTITHNNNDVQLRNLVSDDPDDPNDKNWRNGEPDEVEVEWQLLQIDHNSANGGPNGELVGAPEDLNQGDEIITRRYEFFKYVGLLDNEIGEAMADRVGPDGIHGVGVKMINGEEVDLSTVEVVGDYVGSQMSAFDNELPVGLIEHLPDGEIDVPYTTRTVVIAAVPFTATTTGELPDGMAFDPESGQLSGTPIVSGIFTFGLRVTATNNPVQTRTYTFAIAAAGEELPPHSTVDTSSSPLDAGNTTGGGFYTNDTTATVTATPAAGFAFANWTENGGVVSRSAGYTFTNIVNRSLAANFVPMPRLSYSQPQPGTLAFTWPTNDASVVLQQNADLNTTNWSPLAGDVTSQGNSASKLDALTPGNRFYRVRVVP